MFRWGYTSGLLIVKRESHYQAARPDWTSRKSHTGFRLMLKVVTLNKLQRRNGRYFCQQ